MNDSTQQRLGTRRVVGMVVGIVIIGLGIALFKQSHLGNDSISALNMRLAELFGISLGVQNIAANLLMFAIEIWVGRQYIGLGTFVNGICIGFIVTAFYDPIAAFFGPAASLPEQLLWVAAAVIVTALGASLYQTADLGIAPYDALALELRDHTPVPYFGCRVFTDAVCALACWVRWAAPSGRECPAISAPRKACSASVPAWASTPTSAPPKSGPSWLPPAPSSLRSWHRALISSSSGS